MPDPSPATPVVFYRTAGGAEPVRDWLKTLPVADRHAIGHDLALVQYGRPVGMPLCRPLGGGLREVRSTLPGPRIARMRSFFTRGGSASSTAFSRRPRRRHLKIWNWLAIG